VMATHRILIGKKLWDGKMQAAQYTGPLPLSGAHTKGERRIMNAQLQPARDSDFRLLINGKLVPGAATFEVINPATEAVYANCPRADLNQLNEAVAAARAAFPAWKATPLAERARLLNQLADAIEANAAELAPILTQEQGKPLGGAHYELAIAAGNIRGFTAMDLPDTVLQEDDTSRIIRQRLPL